VTGADVTGADVTGADGNGGDAPRVTVLQSFPRPRPTTNPYLCQLVAALPGDVRVRYFSWRTALVGGYDVLHVHWPERLLWSASRPRALARRAGVLLLLGLLRARRVGVVRTVHNPQPHERPPAADRLLLRALDGVTCRWVRLNPATTTPDEGRTRTVLHGHYRGWFAAAPPRPPVRGRLLWFGLLRPYKGVEALLAAFAQLEDADVTLRVVGAPAAAAPARAVLEAAGWDARIGARLEHVDDAALREEIEQAELVVLPYREMHNSGAALLALSLDRPVLVPDGASTAALADEVGPGWVHRYGGELTAEAIAKALAVARATPQEPGPDLSRRAWPAAGLAHREVYLAARDDARRRGRRRRT
jgi:beta-1,4-mannosyltransferase